MLTSFSSNCRASALYCSESARTCLWGSAKAAAAKAPRARVRARLVASGERESLNVMNQSLFRVGGGKTPYLTSAQGSIPDATLSVRLWTEVRPSRAGSLPQGTVYYTDFVFNLGQIMKWLHPPPPVITH